MKLIGLDVGDRRIGLAFGDTDLRMATPLDVIARTNSEQDAESIRRVADNYNAESIVVGLPKNMNGTIGEQARMTQTFAEQLGEITKIPIVFWDERLSTHEATRRLHESESRRGKKSRRGLDAIAAAVILQDYLDSQVSGKHAE